MALNFVLRKANALDLAQLEAIENESFPDPSWKAPDFLRYDCWVAEYKSSIAGFLVSRQTFAGSPEAPPEREILNLAVSLPFRRHGVGSLLLTREIEQRTQIFLEVRESNRAARQLYRKLGFEESYTRNTYYQNPEESGIVMRLKW